jgi:predicted esterase
MSLALILLVLGQGSVEKKIPGYDKPVLAFIPNHPQPGLVMALHGTGGSGPQFARGIGAQAITNAGYIVVCPTSLLGAWGSIATGGTPEGRKKEVDFIKAILDTFTKEYNVHPDKIHFIGYSAGSMFSCSLVAFSNGPEGHRVRSICGHSGGFTSKSRAPEARAKETSVWILNGSKDTTHAELSKNMFQAFKDSGYDAKYQEIPGAGHSFPLVPMSEILAWWQSLDKTAGDYAKIKKGNEALEKKNYPQAYAAFMDAKKDKSERVVNLAEEGLAKIAQEANRRIADAKAKPSEEAKKLLQDIAKQFAKTPHADAALAEIK